MKKVFLISSLCVLALCSCGTPSSSSVIDASSSSDASSSQDTSSSSSETSEEKMKRVLTNFGSYLASVDKNVNSSTVSISNTTYHLTDADPLAVTMKTRLTSNRYIDATVGGISESIGVYYFPDGDEKVEEYPIQIQTFAQGLYFYRIYNYAPETGSYKESGIYKKSNEDITLSIGFTPTDLNNFAFMKANANNSSYTFTYEGMDEIPTEDGSYSYSYSATQYVSATSKTIDEQISYQSSIVVSGGSIISSTQLYKDDKYAGGIKANWSESTTSMTFEHGEYKAFTGTVLNPSDFDDGQ
jgi:hypothetical protein